MLRRDKLPNIFTKRSRMAFVSNVQQAYSAMRQIITSPTNTEAAYMSMMPRLLSNDTVPLCNRLRNIDKINGDRRLFIATAIEGIAIETVRRRQYGLVARQNSLKMGRLLGLFCICPFGYYSITRVLLPL